MYLPHKTFVGIKEVKMLALNFIVKIFRLWS